MPATKSPGLSRGGRRELATHCPLPFPYMQMVKSPICMPVIPELTRLRQEDLELVALEIQAGKSLVIGKNQILFYVPRDSYL